MIQINLKNVKVKQEGSQLHQGGILKLPGFVFVRT